MKKKALLVGDLGDHYLVALETASLFNRAGFDVDLVTNNSILRKLNSINEFVFVERPSEIPQSALEQSKRRDYDLIIILDDYSLDSILHSRLSDEVKLKLLPVETQQDFKHIGSKCALSLLLKNHDIRTPDFFIAHSEQELEKYFHELGSPCLVKIDFSGAGNGVFECNQEQDIKRIGHEVPSWPVLLQRKIDGEELDLSAFYQDSKLIHFSYSSMRGRALGKFSPSALRLYSQLSNIECGVFDDLRRLGVALGANGFVNISCIRSSADSLPYFIEADMRPNVWVNYPKYFGDDPAIAISKYFSTGEVISHPYPVHKNFPSQMILPYFSRIKLWELSLNKYKSWSFIPDTSLYLILLAPLNKSMKNVARRFLKPAVPDGLWLMMKRAYEVGLRFLTR